MISGKGAHTDQHHAVPGAQGVDDFQGLAFGCFKACTFGDIVGVHAGGGVNEQGHLAAADCGDDGEGAGQGQHQGCQYQQLQEQEEVAAQALPGGIRFGILQDLLPEEVAADGGFATAQFEQIEQDDGQGECQAREGDGSQKAEHADEPISAAERGGDPARAVLARAGRFGPVSSAHRGHDNRGGCLLANPARGGRIGRAGCHPG